jgi:hypothetical protein
MFDDIISGNPEKVGKKELGFIQLVSSRIIYGKEK